MPLSDDYAGLPEEVFEEVYPCDEDSISIDTVKKISLKDIKMVDENNTKEEIREEIIEICKFWYAPDFKSIATEIVERFNLGNKKGGNL